MSKTQNRILLFMLEEIIGRFKYHNISAYGAQLAYFFLLSLFPFIIFLIAILSHFSISLHGAFNILSKVVPKEAIIVINDYVEAYLPTRSINVLSISILATIWSASRAVNALINGLNNAYDVQETRGFLKKRLLAMLFTVLVALSIVLALTIPNMGMDFLLWLSKFVGLTSLAIKLWYYLRWFIIIFILFLVLGSLYLVAPNTNLKFKEIVPGTIFAIIGWIAISIGFSYFVNNFRNYTIVYGSLTTIIILMIWLYLSGIILILGGEMNSLYSIYQELNKKEEINA
ncbi:YihY/virulence factor BrkB family protein [Paramaledivibacter caminithermalis]|jgi:membrane protein|uniref:Membrane protein n=1 Tax=Paramaledivibacter caminithermalis (strain DSM 15212 / CIP 107654 / DViRD3) TaxID=1121301 RepID=A0A1M6NNZ7_PARC5|nr:YihY/virulence factor BrkB family protein [Paramaledivibacter caminithermalis]SHJ97292.1 membrane protein [Paramaledivibacter caminithermalis DSM 15212]